MPLSTVCVSTVSSRPRTWSSYSNIRAKDVQDLINMNSTEEITIYKDPNDLYQSPTLTRRTLGYSYDFPEKSQKKDKKWSIGSIFRRKKKDESDSSTEDDSQKKGFLGRRKKKTETKRKKPVKAIGTFDHVVIPPVPRNSQVYNNAYTAQEDIGILSDPSGGFSNYIGRALPQIPSNETNQKILRESQVDNSSKLSGSGSVDSVTRKSRREMVKARVEAKRTSNNGSSSDEDSQMSNSSLKIRSEENLRQRDISLSRRSRAARTERYLKRHSRDGENPHNYLRLSKSDVENSTMNWKLSDDSNRSPSRSPLVPSPVAPSNAKNKLSYTSLNSQSTNLSGISTIPPSHTNHKYRVSNSTSNPSYRPPQSMNDYNNSTKKLTDMNVNRYFNNQRSISCDANIHKAPSTEFNEEVIHVQFPITRPNRGYRNLSLIDTSQLNRVRQPPPPPPRDPNRMMGHYFENGRPNTYYFDSSGQVKSRSFSGTTPHPMMQQTKKFSSFNLHPNYRSTSEDCIPTEQLNVQLATRPSSATDAEKSQRFITRRREVKTNPEEFNYLTDRNPRSRKPIFIQTESRPSSMNQGKTSDTTGSNKALDFWKQIDKQNSTLNNKGNLNKARSNSPQMFTSHTHVQTKVFLPSVLQNDINNCNNNKFLDGSRNPSPFKPVSPSLQKPQCKISEEATKEEIKRKSSNLEEALDELEAIYNSLRLGDEDLLERAEQREKETQAKKLLEANIEPYPGYGGRGTLSDSSFSYEPFDTVDSPRRKRMFRKNRTADIKHDDMAFRKIHKDRANTISDPQSVIAKVSYLLASPVHGKGLEDDEIETRVDGDEPDITYDDVVYRNVKHANKTPKVIEPQPPFGIPLGPITPAANSDYLHAKPDDIYRPVFKSRKIPDIVKDDLAFRNLRKDSNKAPALPPLSAEDFRNNNSAIENNRLDLNYLQKKRAQRSLSANIGSLIHNDIEKSRKNKPRQSDSDVENEFKTLTDIADAMEIARKVLKEKENKISATRKAFMSDTDTKYVQPHSSSNSLRESRLNFLNGLKATSSINSSSAKPPSPLLGDNMLSSKPPRGLTPERKARSPKESTPIPLSPLEDKKSNISGSTSSSLEDLLNALAEEAKETTERITNELKMLGEEKQRRTSLNRNEIKPVENIEDKDNGLTKKLSEIDAVSERAKMCEKLLESVVDSNDLMTSTKSVEEEVKQIEVKPAVIESANVVLSRDGSKEEDQEIISKIESDHDYENLVSDKELNVAEVDVGNSLEGSREPETSCSPFEERKAELVASFQELKQNIDDIEFPMKRYVGNNEKESGNDMEENELPVVDSDCNDPETDVKVSVEAKGVTGKQHSNRRSRSRLPRWLRFHSVGSVADNPEDMSVNQESRSERMARYKEERRRQLAAQFGVHNDLAPVASRTRSKDTATSSSSEGPRPTRASKLRAAALSAQETTSNQSRGPKVSNSEKSPTSPLAGNESKSVAGSRSTERDKSSKRKSNLNRSLASEEVPSTDASGDPKNRRRRRRFFPPEVLEQSKDLQSDDKTKSDMTLTASHVSQPSTSPITASSPTSKVTPKKSDLRVHMENARRGATPAFSEMGRYKPFAKRAVTSSPKPSSPRTPNPPSPDFNQENVTSKSSSKENLRSRQPLNIGSISDNDNNRSKNIAKRMEELTAFTRQTLARVERLANKNKESPKKETRKPLTSSPIKQIDRPSSKSNRKSPSLEKSVPSSILKKKSVEELPIILEPPPVLLASAGPVSILKRKVLQNDHSKLEDGLHASTPPVTFSPSVVEPTTTKRKQGILKKRRSLDESTVMRHRSCSPDVANKSDSRSILKNQRRSSLEELTRTQSPEMHLHGILKRKTSRNEEDDHSLNSPQSILKRRSGASSAGSTSSTPHVSITTAVILAAAGGAEMVLEPENEPVKPILKKKSFSEDYSFYSESSCETPKPILKKKSSTETDDSEEKPKPILKLPKSSLEKETLDTGQERSSSFKHTDTECEVRPILKQSVSREESPRARLSFGGGFNTNEEDEAFRKRPSRRCHTICTDFNVSSLHMDSKEEDRLLRKPRPLSVHELVMSFEKSTGAIPKRSSMKRNNDRYRTQPVTSNELEASLNLVKSPTLVEDQSTISHTSRSFDVHSLLDFTSSLENDSHLNNIFTSSLHNPTSPESTGYGKMSSDSAFQSLGDGLELEQEDDKASHDAARESTRTKGKLEPSKLELQMKAIAEEAKKMRLGKGNAGIERYRTRKTGTTERMPSRFSTQPVTYEEVQEASRINQATDEEQDGEGADPCNLSLLERIKMFDGVVAESKLNLKPRAGKRPSSTRRSLDSATANAAAAAYELFVNKTVALGDFDIERSERKSILKPPSSDASSRRDNLPSSVAPKSALKKRDANVSPNRRSILKAEVSPDKDDEGISCNDDSDSDSDASPQTQYSSKEEKRAKGGEGEGEEKGGKYGKFNGDSTSEGESSGGREIRSIFKNDNRLRVMQTLENVLSKSKSQGAFGNEKSEQPPIKKTINIRRSHTHNEMPRTIADLRAKLQERGESEWRKRIPQSNNATDELKLLKEKNRYNDELSEKSLLASKKDELDAAAKQWKSRVEKSDAEKFSVAGKMGEKIKDAVPTINIPPADNKKRTPQAKRFKLKEGSDSTPTSPEKNNKFDLIRSKSVPYSSVSDHDSSGSESSTRASGRKVSVPKPDDFTFETFFKSVEQSSRNAEPVDLSLEDFDAVERQSLLVIKKNVQVQRRRGTTRNPIKALASRTDIANEYTEVITGVAERETKRLNIEKLAKHSNKALEALAGLASNEDFKSVALKKSTGPTLYLPWKDLMLLQVKGRRHIQTRLVEPVSSSINEGDNFILITPTVLYNYVGAYSNVIEQSRAADIAHHIQKTSDMGCKVEKITMVNSKSNSKQAEAFWKLLGAEEVPEVIEAGHPSEDETYESNILNTNMIYTLDGEELVPHEKYWGAIPKFEMLQEGSIYVFDFGSEMYVWSGKNAHLEKKRLALKLAKEMWEGGYNYSECNICPLNIASILGAREQAELQLKADKRPDWAMFAKVTQHRETVLFREKFLDWPDFSRVIRIKSIEETKEVNPSYDIQPCNVKEMLQRDEKGPDVVIENIHLGRGDKYFDEETRRLFEYDTLEIKAWRILENTHEELKDKSIGQFYDGDSYIYSWKYRQTVKGRELNGKPSKYAQVGRDRCVFFCWHGSQSSINEKCTAAFLTVELDKQNAPQVRVVQGSEPAAFLRLFDGSMVIHKGKRGESGNTRKPRLFIVRGEVENEIYLMEVPLSMSSLRSRSSFVIIDTEEEHITIWHGCKSSQQKRKVIKDTVSKIMKNKPSELYLEDFEEDLTVVEMDEGSESEDFFDIMGNNRKVYMSLLDSEDSYDYTLRLFRMSSVTGNFIATEILCPHRSEHSSPYPFVQSELYSASQPALFLIDNHHELWLWQGWWPEKEDEIDLSDQTGSGAVRWQAERKAAMQTALDYWKATHKEDEPMVAYLVWAGLEPLQFKNLFPTWSEKEDVAELNKKEGKKPGDMTPLEKQLALLSRSTYPLSELLQRPLPDGVDPTHIEKYLSAEDFQELLLMTKDEFDKLPSWKKTALKKEKGLF